MTENEKPPGLTVGQLRTALAGLSDDMTVTSEAFDLYLRVLPAPATGADERALADAHARLRLAESELAEAKAELAEFEKSYDANQSDVRRLDALLAEERARVAELSAGQGELKKLEDSLQDILQDCHDGSVYRPDIIRGVDLKLLSSRLFDWRAARLRSSQQPAPPPAEQRIELSGDAPAAAQRVMVAAYAKATKDSTRPDNSPLTEAHTPDRASAESADQPAVSDGVPSVATGSGGGFDDIPDSERIAVLTQLLSEAEAKLEAAEAERAHLLAWLHERKGESVGFGKLGNTFDAVIGWLHARDQKRAPATTAARSGSVGDEAAEDTTREHSHLYAKVGGYCVRCNEPWSSRLTVRCPLLPLPQPPAPDSPGGGEPAEYDPLELAHRRCLAFAPDEPGSVEALREICGLLTDAIRERCDPPSSVGFVTVADIDRRIAEHARAAETSALRGGCHFATQVALQELARAAQAGKP